VRRGKAALFHGSETRPATAPAGSNRGNCGGNETVEAFGEAVTKYGDGASVQDVTRVNAEQASKRSMRGPTRIPTRLIGSGRYHNICCAQTSIRLCLRYCMLVQ